MTDVAKFYASFPPSVRDQLLGIDPNEAISRSVRALRAAHDMSPYVLAELLGLKYGTVRRRLAGLGDVGWTAAEVARVAALFNQTLADLYSGQPDLNAAIGARDTHGYQDDQSLLVSAAA